ncbi:ferredoxin [Candidatus Falkowbacteria bacterium CG10_big_fil_rev_8_21_14_0_10_37_14]|uniref:Ferredoxin n=1 Tax=Candidatus Falkowbacteria bacterium CG10_big_fil_rev_8_21_14_0_10_37_14 TaxID=1974561 RepID=A0A2M6WST7_9BACT|nr:ferredoxin [Candidatus Falkowbacteria bacterium]PIT95883.1 MAG: ferredoxin [Candidatus Falkowbacteria bacterium CG10_big_fil_rev_8_21_14_0_10_37_14]
MSHKVNADLCIGCGACASLCPEGFQINSQGKAEAIGNPSPEAVQDAIDSCPVAAITTD